MSHQSVSSSSEWDEDDNFSLDSTAPLKDPRLHSYSRKTKNHLFAFGVINICFVLLSTLIMTLVIKDSANAAVRPQHPDRVKATYIEIGSYPCSGTVLVFASACIDTMACGIFVCGYFCHCAYAKNYMRFLFLNFLLCMTGTIILFLTESAAEEHMEVEFEVLMKLEYFLGDSSPSISFIDRVQRRGRCCGFHNSSDWLESVWWERAEERLALPASCCLPDRIEVCGLNTNFFPRGCSAQVYQILGVWRKALKWVAMVKIFLVVCAVLLATILQREISSHKDKLTATPIRTYFTARRFSQPDVTTNSSAPHPTQQRYSKLDAGETSTAKFWDFRKKPEGTVCKMISYSDWTSTMSL